MNSNFKVIALTRLGIKAESTAPEPDALTALLNKPVRVNSDKPVK